MVETSAGKKLSNARKTKGLSIDAVAHATKMRPDKILALENDDLSRFGSVAYAKGFLLIYSRFLSVDVTEQLHDLEQTSRRVSIEDYQYLTNAPDPVETEPLPLDRLGRRPPKPPSILPLVVFLGLCGIAAVVLYVWNYSNRLAYDRAPEAPVRVELTNSATPLPSALETSPEGAPAAAEKPPEALWPVVKPATATASARAGHDTESPAGTSAVTPGGGTLPPVMLASTVPPPPETTTSTDEVTPASGNILSVEPLRKTYVKIRESAESPIIYQNYVYPIGRPLKVPGNTFYVEVEDGSAVQIRINGRLIAYSAPGISVP